MTRLGAEWATGLRTTKLGRVTKTPADLALARRRDVRLEFVVGPTNVNFSWQVLAVEGDSSNIDWVFTAVTGWNGIAVH